MNMTQELKKPLYMYKGHPVTLFEARATRPTTELNSGYGRLKASNATAEIANEALTKLASYSASR